ncbi:aminomethyl-transferring glycine dehydrogenase subunit GcvPA [Desulfospira joergensenii]|uniref:aminomethyl-transferring glycine dehydrogenase subunit GcvPA n=1 Tax=Desulfospira joergensenii TaxID=53329 RepID=UPI0003B332E5|nr:aminomethyl-transferring glycine dehydrogenase subunit GcvPA [Desulfospira joergensenii]
MSQNKTVYPYIPNSVPEIQSQMLKEINVNDIMELYEEIPDHLKFKGTMNLPEPIHDEYGIRRHVEGLLKKNKNCSEYLNFLGAGCAQHFIPAVCDEVSGRGEFLTAYVGDSYADHGKWQALFEYASNMGELLDMDVLSCPVYDGHHAAARALRMASRACKRKEILMPSSVSPDGLLVIKNYLNGVGGPDLPITFVDFDSATGLMNLSDLESKISNKTAAVFIENPCYLGMLETQAEKIGKIAKEAGAEFVVKVDPISCGVIAPPAHYGATLACGDSQSLGIHMQCGGGQTGFIASRDDMKYISEFTELMFGITETVKKGEYGFGEVLYDRTSYGSREKGKEFTGTTTGLWAITTGAYLALMGPKGMEQVGRTIMQNAAYAAKKIEEIPGVEIHFPTPFFKEFVVNFNQTGKSVAQINQKLMAFSIFGGKDLSFEFPDLGQSALYCVTEIMNSQDIDKLVYALKAVV